MAEYTWTPHGYPIERNRMIPDFRDHVDALRCGEAYSKAMAKTWEDAKVAAEGEQCDLVIKHYEIDLASFSAGWIAANNKEPE